jgi:hypothetical protein
MAEKKLTIVVAAKNATKAALSSVGDSLAKIGKTALNVGKMILGAMTGAAVAVGAFATKALMAWAKQESAVRALSGALTANGEAASKAMPELERLAAAIQDETGAADESTLAGMAKMRMLGVQTSKLGEAAKAVIALKAVGMEEAAAQKAVAMAMQGNYDLLQRYVPALRQTKDETEKARIVNQLFAAGYEQQKGLLNTTGGAWAALKGRIGDTWEEVGKAISQNGALVTVLQKAGDKVKELTARFAEWVANGGMIEAIATARQFGENMRSTFTIAGVYAKGFFKGGITEPAAQAFQYLGSAAVAAWDVLKDLFSGRSVAASWDTLKKALAGGMVEESKAFKEMYADLDAERQRHADKSAQIEADQLAALKANAEKRVEIETTALAEISEAEEQAAEAAKKAAEERNAEIKKLADEREQIEKDVIDAQNKEREAAWDKEKARLEEELNLKEQVAKAAIKDVIAAAKKKGKADKQAAKDADKEAKRAALFEERKRKGGRLDKKQAEFLKAFQDREAARQAIPGLQDQINVANQNLAALQQQGLTLAQMLARLNEIDQHQKQLLAMG